MEPTARTYAQAATRLRGASYVVAFTGAGISVESGIPPFRGPGGIWERYDPHVLDLDRFYRRPAQSWTAIREMFFGTEYDATPNAAHRVLADWETHGILKAIITQNIDNLHTMAGNKNVIEYHGNTREVVCTKTGKVYEFNRSMLDQAGMEPPRSPAGDLLKPNFVFFGEGIPAHAAVAAERHIEHSDVVLVVGSTGEVYPAAALPQLAASRGATIIEVNPYPSSYTKTITDVYLPAPATDALARLNAMLLGVDR